MSLQADAGDAPPGSIDDPQLLAGVSVLVVDDEPTLRFAIVQLLTRVGAHARGTDGREAVARAAAAPVDLLLTDMDMPGRDGPAVASAVAAVCPLVTIVFMSGRSRDVHRANGRLFDHDLLVEKPFAGHALVSALVAALAAARVRGEPAHARAR
jgi:CheY-like chemotaxis protein